MLTIFSTPKPFCGHIRIIQTNAIQSWLLLRPSCEVILFGNGEGTAEVASELGTRHIPDVVCNEYGTPLVNSMFSIAQGLSNHQLMCYVNADIILMDDFLPAIRRVGRQSFLLIGRRWDTDLNDLVDFSNPQWERCLRAYVAKVGTLHGPSGIDYFVFPHGLYRNIPPFAIGRPGWDNWMIYRARSLKVPVIDATKSITAVHQNHDYSHHPAGETGVWAGPEAKRNRELGEGHFFSLRHATWILTPTDLKAVPKIKRLYFQLRAMLALFLRLRFLNTLMKALAKLKKVQ